MTQLAFDLLLEPTASMKAGTQTVWQCAWCGCVVVCPTGRKPTGSCPAECEHPDHGWWRQHFPIAGLRLARPEAGTSTDFGPSDEETKPVIPQVSGPRTHLELVAPCLISLADIIGVATGSTWRDLYTRSTTPGYAEPGGLSYTSGGNKISITDSPLGPGTVTWAQIAQVIRAGITDDLVASGQDAYARYIDSDPAATADMRAVTREVVERGLASLRFEAVS